MHIKGEVNAQFHYYQQNFILYFIICHNNWFQIILPYIVNIGLLFKWKTKNSLKACWNLHSVVLTIWLVNIVSMFFVPYLIQHIGSQPNKQQYLCMGLNICVWWLSILCQLSLFSAASTNTQRVESEVAIQFRLISVYPFDQAVFEQVL